MPASPGICATIVPGWGMCGGAGSGCPAGFCADIQWACCAAGYGCVRQDQWYYQCQPVTTPPPPSTNATCVTTLPVYSGCGGSGGTCPAELVAAGKCFDAPWETYCCASGSTCVRQSQYYYQCLPATPTSALVTALARDAVAVSTAEPADATARAAAVVKAAAIARTLATQGYDALVLTAPATATRAAGAVRLRAHLSRRGLPVVGAAVQFTVVTSQAGSSQRSTAGVLEGVTDEAGVATVAVPRVLRGRAGSTSVVEAVTTQARALATKGEITVTAQPAAIAWRRA